VEVAFWSIRVSHDQNCVSTEVARAVAFIDSALVVHERLADIEADNDWSRGEARGDARGAGAALGLSALANVGSLEVRSISTLGGARYVLGLVWEALVGN